MEELKIYGNDWDTLMELALEIIHVVDVAKGHLKALEFLQNKNAIPNIKSWNW